MNALHIIKAACIEALDTAEDDPHWRGLYCSVLDPNSGLEMVGIIERLLAHAEATGAAELVASIRRRIN